MDTLREWVICLIFAAVAGTFATVISPRGSMDKTVRAVISIFVVTALCMPLNKIRDFDFSADAFSDYETDYSDELANRVKDICISAVNSQVSAVADALETEVLSVAADISVDSNNCIIIHNISIKITDSSKTEKFKGMLSEVFEAPITVNA